MATTIRTTIATAAFAALAAFAPVGAALTLPAAAPTADAAQMCAPNHNPIYENMHRVPPAVPGAEWTFDGRTTNVDFCKDLSYAELTTKGGTVSSPKQLMLFHKGEYLGVGTEVSMPYQRITHSDGTSVTVQYGVRGSSNAEVIWQNYVTYRWVGDHVRMEGKLPIG